MSGIRLGSPVRIHAPNGEVYQAIGTVHDHTGQRPTGFFTRTDHEILIPFIMMDKDADSELLAKNFSAIVDTLKKNKHLK